MGRRHEPKNRRRVAVIAMAAQLLLGCAAGRQPATRSAGEQRQSRDVTRRSQDLLQALKTGDAQSAERDFDARLRAALPPSALAAHFQALVAQLGELGSWQIARRDEVADKRRLSFELRFQRGVADALVVFDADDRIVGLFFSRAKAPEATTTEPAETAPAREVLLSVGPLALAGSLLLPDRGAPAAAVVMVAGSGPSDRDETVGNVHPFRDLARGLAARGIASLRFDKRTYAHPEAFDPRTTTVETETLADAVSAVELLRSRSEIDPRRLFVVGHSLGALLAPEVAERARPIAGLVLLAAPGRPVPEIVLEQLRDRGADRTLISQLEKRIQRLPELAPSEDVLGVPALYWQDLARRDELGRAARLGVPVLLLRGRRDRQVGAIDQDAWVRALSGHVDVDAATLPGLDHLFVPDAGGDTAPRMSPDAVNRVADFIQRTGTLTPRPR